MAVGAEQDLSKVENGIPLKQARAYLDTYLQNSGLDLRPGTSAYQEYLLNQLMYGSNQQLAQQPNYDFILDCAACYLSALPVVPMQQTSVASGLNKTKAYRDFMSLTIDDIIEQNQDTNQEPNGRKAVPRAYPGYRAADAITYARRYAILFPGGHNWGDYADYSADCTNFVSQILVAGGVSMTINYDVTDEAWPSTDYWFHRWIEHAAGAQYYRTPANSTSFIQVVDFFEYWRYRVTQERCFTNAAAIQAARPGDVIQWIDGNGVRYYSIFVSAPGSYCAHSTDRLDAPISNISGVEEYCIFHFTTI